MSLKIAMNLILKLTAFVWPAYKTWKALEAKKPRQLQTLCEYWLLIGILTFLEPMFSLLFAWLPIYRPLEILFVVYLWHPQTEGVQFVYGACLRPLLTEHRKSIDSFVERTTSLLREYVILQFERNTRFLLSFLDQQRHVSRIEDDYQVIDHKDVPVQ